MMPVTFTKVSLPNGWLGNMSPFPVNYAGRTWPTAEHLFQALRFADAGIRERIRVEKSPMSAKMLAKSHASDMVITPCSEEDRSNMAVVLGLKLEQHPKLQELLLATGDEIIIEDVSNRNRAGNHRFWGMALVNGEWEGQNWLGAIWMQLRDELRRKTE